MNTVRWQTTNRAVSIDEWGSFFSARDLKICFIAAPPRQLQIKNKNIMKTSATINDKTNAPSLFQIAAQIEKAAPAASVKPATSLNKTPLADLMLHPEKVEPVLAATKNADRGNNPGHAKPAKQTPAQKKRGGDAGKRGRPSLVETKFQLEAPQAMSVKLAADFTDWEKTPLDMTQSKDGVWHALIPLPPGNHSYRFIVDGQWCDDPHPAMCVPNPFGTVNAVMRVT
jgi:hypothetical protein